MADPLVLMAEPRTALGKKNGALRREGKVPGVVYGPGYERDHPGSGESQGIRALLPQPGSEQAVHAQMGWRQAPRW